MESYIKRLQKLEEIADAFDGVENLLLFKQVEIRIMVIPEETDDAQMVLLSREIAKRIENELEYPGQIKVHLIRETRAIEYAK